MQLNSKNSILQPTGKGEQENASHTRHPSPFKKKGG